MFIPGYEFLITLTRNCAVVVGMSGGVDSSVAALLLSQKDYDLSAVYMRNWDTRDESGTDKGCEWEKDWEDVERVCRKLDIPVTLVRWLWSAVDKEAEQGCYSGRFIQGILESRLCTFTGAMAGRLDPLSRRFMQPVGLLPVEWRDHWPTRNLEKLNSEPFWNVYPPQTREHHLTLPQGIMLARFGVLLHHERNS
jgi:tRNA methyl transferase